MRGNLRDYMDENVVAHAVHHNAFLNAFRVRTHRQARLDSQLESRPERQHQPAKAHRQRPLPLNLLTLGA
jgi:hypothetical protein